MSDTELLAVRDLGVRFNNDSPAVNRISFNLSRGRTIALVGESGSGKSSVCYGLTGLLPRSATTTGSAKLDGVELIGASERALRSVRGKRIGMVFQDPVMALNPYLRIGEQIVESMRVHHHVSSSTAKKTALDLLGEVGIADAKSRFNQYPHQFSGGMCQRVVIAMALIAEPDLLLADEPTSALDVQVEAQIMALIKRLQKERQLGLLLVSHDLNVVKDVADTVVVLENGTAVEQRSAHALWAAPSHPCTRRLIAAIPDGPKSVDPPAASQGERLLTLTNVNVWYGKTGHLDRLHALDDINLGVHAGEVLGVVGESGSGKTTLARAIMRLQRLDSGQIHLNNQALHSMDSSALRRFRGQFQMVFQDPYGSLSPRMTVQQIIAEPLLLHGLSTTKRDACQQAGMLLEEVGLDPDIANRYPHQFSGGQRQRIAIARALACEPRLLVADEIVSALDVTVQATIIELLLGLTRKRRLGVLFISHDLAVVRLVADRVIVMKNGQIVETNDTEAVISAPTHPYTRELVGLAVGRETGRE